MHVYTQTSLSYVHIYTDMHVYAQILTYMHSSDPYEDASDLVALNRFYNKVADQGDRLLDYYDGYRYFKDMGAAMEAGIGPWIRAKIRTKFRWQKVICKAHAKHCVKVEREHKEVIFTR
jgi:hypothetical protein